MNFIFLNIKWSLLIIGVIFSGIAFSAEENCQIDRHSTISIVARNQTGWPSKPYIVLNQIHIVLQKLGYKIYDSKASIENTDCFVKLPNIDESNKFGMELTFHTVDGELFSKESREIIYEMLKAEIVNEELVVWKMRVH